MLVIICFAVESVMSAPVRYGLSDEASSGERRDAVDNEESTLEDAIRLAEEKHLPIRSTSK